MTKRILALFLVCILAIPIISVPAFATAIEETEATEPDYSSTLDSILEYVWDIRSRITAIYNELTIHGSGSTLYSLVTTIKSEVVTIRGILNARLQQLADGITDIYQAITTTLFSFLNEISLKVGNILLEVGSIGDKLNEIINGDDTQQEEADDFQNQIATENTEMSEAVDQIEQATIPDYEGVDTDFDAILGAPGLAPMRFINSIKAIFTNSSLIKTAFVLAFTFAFISYCFYGKR